MNQVLKSPDAKRESRYDLKDGQSVVVELMSEDGLEVQKVDAKLVDLSSSGARLVASESVRVDQTARLRLSISELGVVLCMAAQVCWTQEDEESGCTLGCSLAPGLPDGFLSRLAVSGRIDRRADERIAEDVSIAASWDLEEAWETVSLVNYSPGGFCISSVGSPFRKERCHLRLGRRSSELVVAAQVKWGLEHDTNSLIGCSFLNGRDFDRLQAFVEDRGDGD